FGGPSTLSPRQRSPNPGKGLPPSALPPKNRSVDAKGGVHTLSHPQIPVEDGEPAHRKLPIDRFAWYHLDITSVKGPGERELRNYILVILSKICRGVCVSQTHLPLRQEVRGTPFPGWRLSSPG